MSKELKSQELKDSVINEALEIMNNILYGVDEFEFINLQMVLTRDLDKVKQALIQAKKDKAEIEKLKHDNCILHAELATFEKLLFKKNKGE